METGIPAFQWQRLVITLLAGIGLVLVLPLALAMVLALPVTPTLALIAMTLVIEYAAAPGGIALGLPPYFVLGVLCSVALGITLTLYGLFDTLATRSERIGNFLARSQKKANESSILAKYGIFGLVPCVLILGFYVCPAVAWVCGWRRDYAILLTMAGYILASVAIILVTAGVISILSTGA
ncbi:MAG: small multi-drug export protein [Methanoregula sp.]